MTAKTLAQIEKQIRAKKCTRGDGLREIQERRLYRETHENWVKYLRETWGISRQTAQKLTKVQAHPPRAYQKDRRTQQKRLQEFKKAAQICCEARGIRIKSDSDLEMVAYQIVVLSSEMVLNTIARGRGKGVKS